MIDNEPNYYYVVVGSMFPVEFARYERFLKTLCSQKYTVNCAHDNETLLCTFVVANSIPIDLELMSIFVETLVADSSAWFYHVETNCDGQITPILLPDDKSLLAIPRQHLFLVYCRPYGEDLELLAAMSAQLFNKIPSAPDVVISTLSNRYHYVLRAKSSDGPISESLKSQLLSLFDPYKKKLLFITAEN